MNNTKHRPIYEIALEIRTVWENTSKNGVSPFAEPYLSAMQSLVDADSEYGMDDAKTVVLYFLANARGFRGSKAKRLKQELKDIFKVR